MLQKPVLSLVRPPRWPPFRRQHFQAHFLERKCQNFDYNFTEVCSYESNWQYSSIVWDNGLVPTRRQAIIWSNDDKFTDAYMRSSELSKCIHICQGKLPFHGHVNHTLSFYLTHWSNGHKPFNYWQGTTLLLCRYELFHTCTLPFVNIIKSRFLGEQTEFRVEALSYDHLK